MKTRFSWKLLDIFLLFITKYYILGGVSFEVVDASIVSKTEEGVEDSQKDAFVSADFIPAKTLRRLNSRRGVSTQYSKLFMNWGRKNREEKSVDFQVYISYQIFLFGKYIPLTIISTTCLSLWIFQKSQKLFKFFTRMGKKSC